MIAIDSHTHHQANIRDHSNRSNPHHNTHHNTHSHIHNHNHSHSHNHTSHSSNSGTAARKVPTFPCSLSRSRQSRAV
jgi:hypothetical protein